MATFTAANNVSGYDFRQFSLSRLDNATIVSASNSLIRGQIVPNQYLDLSGSFSYDGQGNLIGGTLTGYAEVMNGITLWSFAGLSISVNDFSFYYVFDDNNGFLNAALAGADTITGSGFNDHLLGFGGNDTINAGNGDDWLDGGSGADTLNGGNGNDTYLYDGSDTINDTGATSSSADLVVAPLNVNLGTMTGVENATLIGSATTATGSGVDNILSGNALANTLSGLGGDDTLYGQAGNDTLNGGTGDDEMSGGFGNDTYNIDAAGDVASEEYVDIVWRNKLTGENHVWSMDGINVVNGVDLDVAYVPLGWEIAGTADFNRDGTSDILWRNSQTGENHLWHMTGTAPSGVNLSVPVIPLAWKIVATADFNSDGYADILWRNSQTGENHLWHMNDATVVSGQNLSRAVIPLQWDVVGAADFDNDGHTDILWRNNVTGENHLWYMNDTTYLSGVNLSVPVIPLAWQIQALADFNTDGNADILWRNSQTGENHLWYMNNATVTAGYNLSVAAVSLDWEVVSAIDTGDLGGSDTAVATVSYVLPDDLENLSLVGAISGTGNAKANTITGDNSVQTIDAGAGADIITGSGGADTLTGGTGGDRFVYALSDLSSTGDHITDFQAGPGNDVIDLRGAVSGLTINGTNLATYVQLAAAGGNTTVSVDRDGAGGNAPVLLLTLDGITGITAADLYNQGNLFVS